MCHQPELGLGECEVDCKNDSECVVSKGIHNFLSSGGLRAWLTLDFLLGRPSVHGRQK
jgi:hypothetical protein